LDSIPERVLDIWWAYYQCEPFGSHWEQVATIAAMVHGNTTMLAATRGIETQSFGVIDFMPSDSMPWAKRNKAKRKGIKKPAAQATIMRQAFGFR
jgi:hypothetical protein